MAKNPMAWACAAVLACGMARGGPVNFKEVPASAKWVAHFDAEAARSSKVMSAFLKAVMSKDGPAKASECSHTCPWAAMPLDKIKGITLFGSRVGERNGAAIVRGTCDKERLVARVGAKPIPDGGRVIYTWTKGKGTKGAHEVALAFPKDDTLVFAANTKQLKAALDVLDGKGDNLGSKTSPLTADVPKGTVLVARAAGLKPSDVGPRFKLFRLISGLDYMARESDGRWEENLHITASTKKAAGTLTLAFQGMKALAELALNGEKDATALMEKAEIKQDGTKVTARFQADATALAREIPVIMDAMEGHWMMRSSSYRSFLGDRPSTGERDRTRP